MNTAYEELTVPELKEQAFDRGIDIPNDARKADIIAALEAQDKELGIAAIPSEPEAPDSKSAEAKNVYEYQMSSTETALISPQDFQVLKLSW